VGSGFPLAARISVNGNFSSHGFFTPKGHVIAATHAISHGNNITVSWEEDGRERQESAEVVKRDQLTGEATLLKVNDPPRHNMAVRSAGSLQVGEAVERYLGPNDRVPGTVTKLYHELEVTGSGGRSVRLKRLLVTTQIAGPGDSGAPITDAKGRVVAMLYGASNVETIGIMIEDIKAGLTEAF